MIGELRAEREAIEDALAVLERLARAQGKRRGRPPAWMAVVRGAAAAAPKERTRVLSEETRKKMAEAQRKRWAAYRKGQAAVSANK